PGGRARVPLQAAGQGRARRTRRYDEGLQVLTRRLTGRPVTCRNGERRTADAPFVIPEVPSRARGRRARRARGGLRERPGVLPVDRDTVDRQGAARGRVPYGPDGLRVERLRGVARHLSAALGRRLPARRGALSARARADDA